MNVSIILKENKMKVYAIIVTAILAIDVIGRIYHISNSYYPRMSETFRHQDIGSAITVSAVIIWGIFTIAGA